MSGAEQVDSFNPLLIVIWATQLLLLGWDYSQDNQIRWSIPIIGSFFIIQIYMVWKTNYDKMMEEQQQAQARALGGPVDTPVINPGSNDLKNIYKSNKSEVNEKKPSKVNINIDSSDDQD